MRMRIPNSLALAAFTAGWGTIAPAASAQSAQQHMLDSTVMVYGAVQEDGKMVPATRASGFVIDASHIATNLDACCGKTDKGQQTVPFVIIGGNAFPGKVVWSSPATQMAILEMEKPTDRPSVAIAPVKLTQKGQPIFTVQWPNPGDKGDPAITKGTVDSVATLDQTNVQVYQANAPMNHANAGGALFDACGNAIGLNQLMKDGSDYAFVIDPMLDGLKSSGVQANVVDAACAASSSSTSAGTAAKAPPKKRAEWRLPEGNEWIPVGVVLGIVALAFRKNTRQQVARALTTRRRTLPEPAPYPYAPQNAPGAGAAFMPAVVPRPAGKPVLRGIAGQYAGASIALDGTPSTLGRDPHAANLVFSSETGSVSKRHCTVRWDAARQVFVLEDHGSTNGTYLSSGERLAPGQPRDLRPGDRFYIGDLRNQFEVGMEESV